MSGPDALRLIGERGLDIPVIVVSGEEGEEVAASAIKAGAHDFVSKYKLTRLCPAVERELQESKGRRRRRQADANVASSLK